MRLLFSPPPRLVTSLLAASSIVVAGCSGSSDPGKDPFGRETLPTGAQENPTPSTDTAAGGDASTTTTPTPGDVPAPKDDDDEAPVLVKNVSWVQGPTSAGGWQSAEVTFLIEKKKGVEINRLQEVSVKFDGTKQTYPLPCLGVDLDDPYGPRVVTLKVEDTGIRSMVSMTNCGSSQVIQETTMPWVDGVTVELRGILDDATPWRATGFGTK